MGSGFSLFFATEAPGTNLGDLPESCVASVLENMEPQQICQVAGLNRAFRGAASADFVWESKLPVNYDEIFRRLFGDFPGEICKKDLYSVLCHPNSFDDGHKVCIFSSPLFCVCRNQDFKTVQVENMDH